MNEFQIEQISGELQKPNNPQLDGPFPIFPVIDQVTITATLCCTAVSTLSALALGYLARMFQERQPKRESPNFEDVLNKHQEP